MENKMHARRQARLRDVISERFGGSQSDLATEVGVTSARISNLLAGKTTPFTEKTARKFEVALGLAVGDLDKEPEDGQVDVDNQRILPRGKYVSIVGVLEGLEGPGGYVDIREAESDLEVFTPSPDPEAYSVQVQGDHLRPRIRSGEFLIIEPSMEAKPGDEVLIRLKDGRTLVKELLYRRSGEISLASVNQGMANITIREGDVEKLELIGAVIRASSVALRSSI